MLIFAYLLFQSVPNLELAGFVKYQKYPFLNKLILDKIILLITFKEIIK
jgi:hypothetical protein